MTSRPVNRFLQEHMTAHTPVLSTSPERAGAPFHLGFTRSRVGPPPLLPGDTVRKWASPPNWYFSLEQSVQLSLGPAPSGVVMCHCPKPSVPCHSEQTVSPASSTHTEHTHVWICHFILLPYPSSAASPSCIPSFSPSPLQPPSQRLFQWETRRCEAHGKDSDQANSLNCCSVLGGGGRRGCRLLLLSLSLTEGWWRLAFRRLQMDLDASTTHLLQPSAGSFLCRQVGWEALPFYCRIWNRLLFFPPN